MFHYVMLSLTKAQILTRPSIVLSEEFGVIFINHSGFSNKDAVDSFRPNLQVQGWPTKPLNRQLDPNFIVVDESILLGYVFVNFD